MFCFQLVSYLPLLRAFNDQFLVGSHKLKFCGFFADPLKSLPDRSHVDMFAGTGRMVRELIMAQ